MRERFRLCRAKLRNLARLIFWRGYVAVGGEFFLASGEPLKRRGHFHQFSPGGLVRYR